MFEIAIPGIPDIIKEFVRRESGEDIIVKYVAAFDDCQVFDNINTGSRYLVQTSEKFDILGFLSMKESYTTQNASVYVFLGPTYILVHFGEALTNDFLTNRGEWECEKSAKGHSWASEFITFQRLGGIIYNYKDWTLVDREEK
jgi:hypothetical protein